jgi:putative Mn2+ efflux pump MntP
MQTELWISYGGFIVAWFCFFFVIQMMKPARRNVSSLVFVVFAAAAVYAITVGLVMRKKLFAQSAEALSSDPRKAFNQWRAANVIGFTCAMNPTIFGVALKFVGASWLMPGILFAVGLGFLVLWRPRSDLRLS